MQELYTRAWVLSREPAGEADELVSLYTESYWKVRARAKSIRKITSKVSSQLQPLSFSKIRLIRRNGPKDGFAVLDALLDDDLSLLLETKTLLLPIARMVTDMASEWESDRNIWEFIVRISKEPQEIKSMQRDLLGILGFDVRHAECAVCYDTGVPHAFVPRRHEFVCAACASRMPREELILV